MSDTQKEDRERDVVIRLENVTMSYETRGQDPSPALRDISLQVRDGEFVFIVGDSGSGKSTLIRLLLRELRATTGTVQVLGQDLGALRHRDVPALRRQLGVVFQDFRLLNNYSVYDNVAFAQRVIQAPREQIPARVEKVLEEVSLQDKAQRSPWQLSGGEQQRVALARAIVNEPRILLCDEPTGNLDPGNSLEIMNQLAQINERGTTVLVVTHNHQIVDQMRRRVITMREGRIVSDEERSGYEHQS